MTTMTRAELGALAMYVNEVRTLCRAVDPAWVTALATSIGNALKCSRTLARKLRIGDMRGSAAAPR